MSSANAQILPLKLSFSKSLIKFIKRLAEFLEPYGKPDSTTRGKKLKAFLTFSFLFLTFKPIIKR